jgi:hemolysin activation/secretion protein
MFSGLVWCCCAALACLAWRDVIAVDAERNNVPTAAKAVEVRSSVEVAIANLPEDTSERFGVEQLRISGNTLISEQELIEDLPPVYNTSDKRLEQAEPGDLYDFRALCEIVSHPGELRQVSRRTMQGLTQYILSVYQDHGYSGIYVYIAAQAVQGETELKDGILPVEIVEAKVAQIKVTTYDLQQQQTEKGFLRPSLVKTWSPAKVAQPVNKKELDDFVNLLNLSPDRYVSAVVSRGAEPETLDLEYEMYEDDPWHYYIQLDNSGTEERQWAPRVGLVNTSLTGMDDRMTALYQGPWESGIEDNYLYFASYALPVFTPRLRLNLYGGRSEFDVSEDIGIDFLGRGSFYGGILTFNLMQIDDWFVDITASLSHEESKVTPSLFPEALGSDVDMDLWSTGFSVYRSDEGSSTSLAFTQTESMGASSGRSFQRARPGTVSTDFRIYTASAAHSQLLDPNKIHRLSGSFRLIDSSGRLVPAKMTTFGGLYSVRGYEEDEIIADGGLLFSAQYEFDLVKYWQSEAGDEAEAEQEQPQEEAALLTKLAPLAFCDLARARIKDPLANEREIRQLCSVGMGLLAGLGQDFNAGIYYGWPLRSSEDTDEGKGRFNFSFVMRF